MYFILDNFIWNDWKFKCEYKSCCSTLLL